LTDSPPPRIAVIINPISGAGRRPDVARKRANLAAALIERRRLDGEVFVTERAGHARELALAAIGRGVTICVAWGGDGTVNEVASALVFSPVSLAIVPSGSGNGLAREIGIPFDSVAALTAALDGRDRVIDAGEVDGRYFFNIAGLGLDARVAHRFAITGLERRGFRRYMEIFASEIFALTPHDYTIVTDTETMRHRALVVAIANGRQYGNGATIAPSARVDDGRLDVVVVDDRSAWAVMIQARKLFSGRLSDLPGVKSVTTTTVGVSSDDRLVYHVDGEPLMGGNSITARICPQALRVRVPHLASS
jgi:YegS/Rv2252/BmrU family lipid kinase